METPDLFVYVVFDTMTYESPSWATTRIVEVFLNESDARDKVKESAFYFYEMKKVH